jgi:hypothetical protein
MYAIQNCGNYINIPSSKSIYVIYWIIRNRLPLGCILISVRYTQLYINSIYMHILYSCEFLYIKNGKLIQYNFVSLRLDFARTAGRKKEGYFM